MPVLNKFPIWKYLLVLAVVAIGLLYASPNLYGRDPAIQVSGAKGADVDLSVVDKVNATLKHNFVFDVRSLIFSVYLPTKTKILQYQHIFAGIHFFCLSSTNARRRWMGYKN
jgi:hypothetical protein